VIYAKMCGILALLCAIVYFVSYYLVNQTTVWTWIINPLYIPTISIIQHWAGIGFIIFLLFAGILFALRR